MSTIPYENGEYTEINGAADKILLTKSKLAQNYLLEKSQEWNVELKSEVFAKKMDLNDPLQYLRGEFYYPKMGGLPKVDKSRINVNDDSIYLCGHSLGLQPKRTKKYLDLCLDDWAKLGVYGHYYGFMPWAKCDYPCLPTMCKLVGGQMGEVGVMNQLTTNLHFVMISFYRPTSERYKILYECQAFPSDSYAINSQIEFHGFNPKDAKLILSPRKDETYIRTNDIIDILKKEGKSIALVLFSGVQYYNGQVFDMETITRVAHEQGCVVGFDIAHAAGNIPMKLHDWNVDFAVWCTYKYLNSGAGCIGGFFIHSNHFHSKLPKLDGWWSNRDSTRFQMLTDIDREENANGYRISNPSIHQCAALAASLSIFEEVGIDKLHEKSRLLTQYLQYLIENELNNNQKCLSFQILTPNDPDQRGAQLSLKPVEITAQILFDELEKRGVVVDIRHDIIRVAPIPSYNSFFDIYQFISVLKTIDISIL
ncbi:unnamed protein product [Didymodactylos carnosus]|uniref:Kynureninase n=1 Tax=Didymodactylos carnosus TaxID=1234261 RepID=A0A814HL24_9BILA|nr:unnamed protein product [Didymodactylos carnosus]CAF1011104.1 unnamed protein product [Didymodactylos carnosus]CAF3596375.1 unnamed protein product [Didymodactylos carnosus]CAF3782415.1 unnamed protein product [Didymodactylos carnosus]